MIKIILATTSESKLEDLTYILREFCSKFEVIPISRLKLELGDAPEDKDTVKGNSEQKLQYYYDILRDKYSGEDKAYLMSEDTGLFIDALGGMPGVKTARFGGSHDCKATNELILDKMNGEVDRLCSIKSCISIISLDGVENDIRSFESSVICEVLTEESEVEGFAFDTIIKPKGIPYSYSELNEIGRMSRLIKLPRFNAVVSSISYILEENTYY